MGQLLNPQAADEARRLARLHDTGILDTAPEPAFDALVRVAATVCGTPIALLSLVDAERQWFKAHVGLPGLSETPRDGSFCNLALRQPGPLVVNDARDDPRLRASPLVTGAPHIRFYAGAPIVLADGTVPGVLCVIDQHPREISAPALQVLVDLAVCAAQAIEQRAAALGAQSVQQALQRTSSALELANRVARIGAWELDPLSQRVHWSALTRELHEVAPDFEPDLATGINFYREGEHRERITAAVQAALQDGRSFDIELQIVTARGRTRWVRAVGVSEMQDGRAVRLYGSFHDIDERMRAQEQRAAQLQAEQDNLAKSAFIARMSHELRTPLNAILGFNELLLLGGERLSAEERRLHVQHALEAGRHLLALVNDVLDLARVESGALQVQSSVLDMVALARHAAADLQPAAAQRGLRLQLELPASAQVRADPTRLRQVLHNLLANAVAYNREGGTVTLRVRQRGPQAVVEVLDTGLGLSEVQQARLFEPFNRLGRESSGVAGTGIGLVITRHLLRLMGSEIEVQSQAGAGSRFAFALPCVDADCSAPRPAPPPCNPPNVRREVQGAVLYIDDDAVNRLLMEAMFGLRPAVRLVCAESGAAGLALAAQQRFDLALIDMMLPDMSGQQVLGALRQRCTREALPCVVVSANALPDQIRSSLAAGFDDYITKPVSVEHLLEVVDHALAGEPRVTRPPW